ncbi:SNF2 family N-terminal domain-domain-containing protein [Catenaria anguillulae PL171]|uniref:SNF2 family N-terminal domain-domain-containing protein n=1 Tax=Catenaria anguillulae PL171 TaxID=765915 RepID=A0A1Y2HY56_9FUNG|nr:SNF2 family N-terminal domain-domain-containing protein [Catenaria anguillulae PL171]
MSHIPTTSESDANGRLPGNGRAPAKPSELSALQSQLGIGVRSAMAVEQSVLDDAHRRMQELDDEDDRRKLAKVKKSIETLYEKLSVLEARIDEAPTSQRSTLRRQMRSLTDSLPAMLEEEEAIKARIAARSNASAAQPSALGPDFGSTTSSSHQPNATTSFLLTESQVRPHIRDRDQLIRQGLITPFASEAEIQRAATGRGNNVSTLKRDFVDFSDDEDADGDLDIEGSVSPRPRRSSVDKGKRRLVTRVQRDSASVGEPGETRQARARKRVRSSMDSDEEGQVDDDLSDSEGRSENESDFDPDAVASDGDDDDGDAFMVDDDDDSDGDYNKHDPGSAASTTRSRRGSHASRHVKSSSKDRRRRNDKHESSIASPLGTSYSATVDDGLESHYRKRIRRWAIHHYRERTKCKLDDVPDNLDPQAEMFEPGSVPDLEIAKGFSVPGSIHPHLFEYQITCLKWLWELHTTKVGGVLADEMGLGKTTQTVAFIASLVYSQLLRPGKPVLVVCPATVMAQWVKEFHRCKVQAAQEIEQPSRMDDDDSGNDDDFALPENLNDEEDEKGLDAAYDEKKVKLRKSPPWVKDLLGRVIRNGHVAVTTYGGLRGYAKDLLEVDWGYVVLDEGHKIRSPDIEITLLCKQLKTPHRIILSGTPIQNNLAELWSIFDFVYPGRLGTLPVFQTEFSVPINIGGYANASTIQVQTAYRCACVLRDLIQPYMLRRLKADVAQDLPSKSEQVLFCKLTDTQRRLYKEFIDSNDIQRILDGKLNSLFGIDALRKICNHPHLWSRNLSTSVDLSGKLVVVRELLRLWKAGNHKVLVFCQTRQMLDIVEGMVNDLVPPHGWATPVKQRPSRVDEFNNDPDVFVFLLTTKVGGFGVNLTGADRIIIFDPDWNPATDAQARERAWRLGQTRHVTIYRLMTTGTIEEKIYHRQIFKQHLSSKVLTDPKQRRYFKLHDLRDLFTLGDDDNPSEETANLIAETLSNRKEKQDDDLVEELEGVSRLEKFVPANDDVLLDSTAAPGASTQASSSSSDRTSNQPNSGPANEDRILSSLLGSASVQTAIQHDAVMETARPELIIVQREAQRIAEEAIAKLRASQQARQNLPVSVPTWTGRSGGLQGRTFGSAASSRAHGGIDSSAGKAIGGREGGYWRIEVVWAIHHRAASGHDVPARAAAASSPSSRSSSPQVSSGALGTVSTSLSDMPPEELAVHIRDFLARQSNTATTAEIVRQFRLRLTSDNVATFRELLKGIAFFDKRESGGWWTLRNEFRDE